MNSSNVLKLKNVNELLEKKPEFINHTPLDNFFQTLDNSLIGLITEDVTTTIYDDIGCAGNQKFVEYCLKMLQELCSLVTQKECINESIVPISLHDMKYFDDLVNLIIIHGIYANLPKGLGIPLEQRQFLDVKGSLKKKYIVPKSHKIDLDSLDQVIDVLYNIFVSYSNSKHYIQQLLLKGPGYGDTIIGLIGLYHTIPSHKRRYEDMLEKLESVQKTYELFSLYSLFINHSSDPYHSTLLMKLSTLPIRRQDGIISLIEFVLGTREDETINTTKLNHLNQILLAKPKNISSVEYFSKLFQQIYEGLSLINRPFIIMALNNLITGFYFKNKRIVQDFLFKEIYKILYNQEVKDYSEKCLNNMINVMLSLSKNSSTDLLKDLVSSETDIKFYSSLWTYAMFLKKHQTIQPVHENKGDYKYYRIILSLIKSFMMLTSNYEMLTTLTMNLISFDHEQWGYGINLETKLPFIRVIESNPSIDELKLRLSEKTGYISKIQSVFQDIDLGVELFVELLKLINIDHQTMHIFLHLLKNWVMKVSDSTIINNQIHYKKEYHNNLLILVDLKLLEKMIDTFKTDIIKKTSDILSLINNLLDFLPHYSIERQPDSDDESCSDDEGKFNDDIFTSNITADNAFDVLLELLSIIISTDNTQLLFDEYDLLLSINRKLSSYSESKQCNVISTRIHEIVKLQIPSSSQDNVFNMDKDIMDRAIANTDDSSIPIRAHGLSELRHLVEKGSPVINLNFVLQLHVTQLHDQDPFIYLNVIKGLTSLCQLDANAILPYLLNYYKDSKKHDLDDILKIGEVFINYIHIQNELFQGRHAFAIIEACLEKVRKYDKEDDRIRMSAISILGVALQINPIGIQSYINDLLDCSFTILQLENKKKDKEHDKTSKLIRRSALHLIYDLFSHSGLSLFPEEYSGSRLKNLLEYLHEYDDDYMVREKAEDLLHLIQDMISKSMNIRLLNSSLMDQLIIQK